MPECNVGQLRKLIANMPDDAMILPDWSEIPDDSTPAIELMTICVDTYEGVDYLSLKLRPVPLEHF